MLRTTLILFLSTSLLPAATASQTPSTRPARPYATANDAPLNPEESINEKTAAYTRYLVKFNGIEPNTRVPAYLYIPANAPASGFPPTHPAVLLEHGTGDHKGCGYIVELAKIAVKHHFVVLTIDLPNQGDRLDKSKPRPIVEGHIIQTMGDYSRAVDYLLSRKEVDPGRITYAGISWGAITGLTFCAHDERIKVVASLVGGGNFLGCMPGKVSDEVAAAVREYDPYYHVALINPRPLLLLNVTNDWIVAPFLSKSLHEAAGPGATKVWLNTDHLFSNVDRPAETEKVIQFIEDHLPASRVQTVKQ